MAIETIALHVYIPPHQIETKLNLIRPARNEMAMEYDMIYFLRTLEPKCLTDNPQIADFYLIPHALVGNAVGCYNSRTSLALGTCNFSRVQQSPAFYVRNALHPFLRHIVYEWPFFNQSNGADHLIIFTNVNGPICEPELAMGGMIFDDEFMKSVIHRMIIIGNHGTYNMFIPIGLNQGFKAGMDLARYSEYRQYCFDWGHDIALPQMTTTGVSNQGSAEIQSCRMRSKCEGWVQLLRTRAKAPYDTYFQGSPTQKLNGLLCSPNIRRFVSSFCKARNRCGTRRLSGIFALAPAGSACWSMRFFDAITNLAIPIILADPIVEPFEQFLDYSLFSIKLQAHHLTGMSGVPAFEHEKHLLSKVGQESSEFRLECFRESPSVCMRSTVARRITALASVQHWLTTPKGVTKLFLLELSCRASRKQSFLCNLPLSARSAMMGSFIHTPDITAL